jgi:hypothetical protein
LPLDCLRILRRYDRGGNETPVCCIPGVLVALYHFRCSYDGGGNDGTFNTYFGQRSADQSWAVRDAPCNKSLASCTLQHATCTLQHAPCNSQHARHHAASLMQHATNSMNPVQHTACTTQYVAHAVQRFRRDLSVRAHDGIPSPSRSLSGMHDRRSLLWI